MIISKTLKGGNVILTLDGRLDVDTSSVLQDALTPAFNDTGESGSVILDFGKMAYVSSAGLRVLFFGEKTAKEKNIPMKIVNVPREVNNIFDMTGFSDKLNIERKGEN